MAASQGHTVAGWTSTVPSSSAVGAVQLVCVGILGEYIGRMYAQMQGRPTYFIAYDSLTADQGSTRTDRHPAAGPARRGAQPQPSAGPRRRPSAVTRSPDVEAAAPPAPSPPSGPAAVEPAQSAARLRP